MKRSIKALILLLAVALAIGAFVFTISADTASEIQLDYKEEYLSSSFSDSQKYPFAVFRFRNGELYDAFGVINLNKAIGASVSWNNTYIAEDQKQDGSGELGGSKNGNTYTSVVLLRRNYETTSADKYVNWAQCQNTITIDLNTNTLTQGAGTEAIFTTVTSKGSSGQGYIFDSTYIVKNGYMLVNDNPVLHADTWESSTVTEAGYYISAKNFYWNFENIIFKYAQTDGTKTESMLIRYTQDQRSTNSKVPFLFNFTGCTYDLTNAPESVTLFNADCKSDNTVNSSIKSAISVNGGEITLPKEKALTVTDIESVNGSSVTFNKLDGNYTVINAPVNASISAEAIVTPEGNKYFVQHGIRGDDVKYLLTDPALKTDFGTIPEQYANPQKYPFILFNKDKGFDSAYSYWLGNDGGGGALDGARTHLNTNAYTDGKYGDNSTESFLVMRRDYEVRNIDGTSKLEYYNNLSWAQGTINIDLGNHTLSGGSTACALITATAKPYSSAKGEKVFPTSLVISNGAMRHYNHGIVKIQTWDSTADGTVSDKVFNFTFNNVTLGFVENNGSIGLVTHVWDANAASSSLTKPATYNFVYNDCVIDASTRNSAVLFKTDIDKAAYATVNHTLNGGVIKSGSSTGTTISNNITEYSSLTFGKGAEGYTKYTASATAAAPSSSIIYTTSEGAECIFTKSQVKDGTATYSFYPKVMVDYNIKSSVTLWSDFVYNIYLPKENVESFTVDGKTVAYEEVELDGAAYYRSKVSLAPYSALSDINLKVALKSGTTTVNSVWTLNFADYAKSVIGGDYSRIEKCLMKDMFSYARAAYAYWDKESDRITEINTILGENYDTVKAPILNGSAEEPTEGLSGVTFILDAKPTIRFYITGEYDSYAFYVGEEKLKAVSGSDADGKYLDMDVYAYAMCDTITYTVNGEKAGSYHINSYYNFVTTDAKYKDNAELINLVARFAKYCESAAAYRNIVALGLECQHNFVLGECTVCGEYDAEFFGTMTLTAPAEIYSNYPARDLSVVFSKTDYDGAVTYTTDHENVFVEDGKIYATGIFDAEATVTVTAKTEHHTATATVKVSTYTGGIGVEKKLQYYEKNIIKEENKGGIIFIGDSYFDGENAYPDGYGAFYKDFYKDWAGEKAFLMGISSSKINDLELASERIVYPMEPAEIVVHIGHNDMHHSDITPEAFVERLKALFNKFHTALPNAKIYYCGAEAKRYDLGEKADRDVSSFTNVPLVNSMMKAYAEGTDWLVYVDTPSIFYSSDSAVNESLYGDYSHPSLIAYDLMRIKINEARTGKTADNVININALTPYPTLRESGMDVNANGKLVAPKTAPALTKEFAISGKLVVTQFNQNNAHMQFSFGSKDRFLLWDSGLFGSTSDSMFGTGYQNLGSYADENNEANSDFTKFDAHDGLILDWAVIVNGGKAYFYINGQLRKTFESFTFEYFNIGATQMNAVLYDIEINVNTGTTDSPDAAYKAHVDKYFNEDFFTINNLGSFQTPSIIESGKTFDLQDNYIIRGKLDIYQAFKENAHLQFRFTSGARFLLWDNQSADVESDLKFGAGYSNKVNGVTTSVSDISSSYSGPLYNAKNGITLDWAIIVKDGTAYWYINNVLVQTIVPEKLDMLNIGALKMDAAIYNIEIFESTDADYTAELAKYTEVGNT